MRTTLGKIVDRAGVPAFSKPFIRHRVSRRTELERSGRFATHVLNDWFWHWGAIAETHCLQVTVADFAEANALDQPSSRLPTVGHLVGQSTGAIDRLQKSAHKKTR